jgi:hypothetical protein
MDRFRFHDLRHTNATLAAASAAPLPVLMARLGHASAAAAIRYQHAVDGQDEAVAEFLDEVARVHQAVGRVRPLLTRAQTEHACNQAEGSCVVGT